MRGGWVGRGGGGNGGWLRFWGIRGGSLGVGGLVGVFGGFVHFLLFLA